MADIFPTALEAHDSPTASGSSDTPSVHRADAVKRFATSLEALQSKVGINGSNVAESLDKRIAVLEATPPGSGAPTNAEYLTAATHAGLSDERVATDTTTVAWDFATQGAAKAAVVSASLTDAHVAAENKDGAAGKASLRTLGTGAQQACAGNDARLSDARTPTSHAASHKSGGGDAIKIDELAAGTDVTTLNATTTEHGLLRKLDGLTTTFLRGDGTWAAPPSGSGNTLYAPGSVTVATGNFQFHCMRLQLTGAQRLTLAGTARFRCTN